MASIVVIEDEPDLRRLIVEVLTAEGHTVHEAPDGEKGFAEIQRVRPRFVCSDINMPVMNGLALKQRVNELGADRDAMTFIFLSGRIERDDVADGLMLGANHYLTKPIDMDRLVAICAT